LTTPEQNQSRFTRQLSCDRALEKDPTRRYASAVALAEDLRCFLRGEPIAARPIGRPARFWRWCKRNPVVASLSVTTILASIGIATVSTLGYFRETELRRVANRLRHRAEVGEDAARETADDLQSTLNQLTRKHTELEAEQGVTRQLNTAITNLEQKRQSLRQAVDDGERNLSDSLLRLARREWLEGNVIRADQSLEKCPESLRGRQWHDLTRLWLPDVWTFEGHACVAFHPNASQMAMAGPNQSVEVWDLPNQRRIVSLTGHAFGVTGVAFSPDGNRIASGSHDRTVRIWSRSDGALVRTLDGHSQPVTVLAFSADGRRLASASLDPSGKSHGEVILWDVERFQEERRLSGEGRVAFGPDDQTIALQTRVMDDMGIENSVVQVWNLERMDGTASPTLTIPVVRHRRTPLAFSPGGQSLAVIGAPRDSSREAASLEIWNLRRRELQQQLPLDFRVHALAFSPDANRVACSGRNGFSEAVSTTFKVVMFNLITGERDRIFPWYQRTVTDLAFDRDGRRLATATGDEIKVWDVTSPSDPTEAVLANIPEHNVGPGDWPQWGGSRSRVNTPAGRNIPADWDVGEPVKASRLGVVPKGSRNIKWAAKLGSQTYGNPVVANGRIFVGTNNGGGYLTRYPNRVDLGVMLCFEEKTGNFRWQHSNEKHPSGRIHDWPFTGVCSTLVVDGDRLWYVSNRGEVVCLDTAGFYDGEDDGASGLEPKGVEWVPVFRVPCKLHADLARLRLAFADAGVEPAAKFHIPFRVKDGHCRLGTSYRNGNLTPSHEIVLEDGLCRGFAIDSQGLRTNPNPLLPKPDELFPGLEHAAIDDLLQEQFRNAGVELPTDSRLEVVEAGRQWKLTGHLFGVPRLLHLKRESDSLTCTKQLSTLDLDEADVVWKFDMMRELGVYPHNMSNCSMITVGGMLFVCTSNGVDEGHHKVAAPEAPSFMAMDRLTGKVLWTDNSPGANILHAQWASPSHAVIDGQPQVIFPGGDGWLYSFDPKGDGRGGSRLLWKFDVNPKESKYTLERSTKNQIISFPAIYDGLVYIVVGEDPEHGEGAGHLWCIDPAGRGGGVDISSELAVDAEGNIIPPRRLQAVDVSRGERAVPNPNSAVRWHYVGQDQNGDGRLTAFEEVFHRSLSIPVIKDDILYVGDQSGLLHCLNAKTGKFYWNYDLLAACWNSALLVDGKVYMCDEDGDVHIFRHSADPHIAMQPFRLKSGRTQFEPINTKLVRDDDPKQGERFNVEDLCNMGSSIYMTPIVANNVLYIATRDTLYAIEGSPEEPAK
jgi:WD40 repeat protein